jgi:hypothetical protein
VSRFEQYTGQKAVREGSDAPESATTCRDLPEGG